MTTRAELLDLANKHRHTARGIDVLMSSYTAADAEMNLRLQQLRLSVGATVKIIGLPDSTLTSSAVGSLPTLASEVVKCAARVDELLTNIAILLEHMGEDIKW